MRSAESSTIVAGFRGQATMRVSVSLGALLLLVSNLCREQAPETVTIERDGTHIDGVSAQPRRNQDILIRGNHIVEVGPAGAHTPPDGAKLIDLSNATVLPGLIDTHTHIFLQGEVPSAGGYDVQILKYPAAFRAARATVAARRALEQGFAAVRGGGAGGAGGGGGGGGGASGGGEGP